MGAAHASKCGGLGCRAGVTIARVSTSRAQASSREQLRRLAVARVDSQEFRRETIAQLRRAVGFDGWCWSSVDPFTALPMSAVAENSALDGAQRRLLELEFGGADVNGYRGLARRGRPVGRLSAATGGVLERSRRWAELQGPCGIGDELRVAITVRGECWGHLVLYRGADAAAFTAADAAFLTPLLRPWAQRHRGEALAALAGGRAGGSAAGSGVLLFEAGHRLVAGTAGAGQVLAALPRRPGHLPLCVTAVLAWLAARTECTATPQLPVRDTSGRWLAVQAHRLYGAVPPGTVTVTVAAAETRQLAPLAMAAAGLTSREREITGQILAGLPTGQIAAALHIAPYTVQDHLRSIFAKFGVTDRRQLAARLLHDTTR